MKVKYWIIDGVQIALKELLNKEVSIKTSLKILKNTDKIHNELKIYHEAIRTITDKYMDAETKKIPEEKQSSFEEEMKVLRDQETEIEFDPITIGELEKEDIKIKSVTIGSLKEVGILIDNNDN